MEKFQFADVVVALLKANVFARQILAFQASGFCRGVGI